MDFPSEEVVYGLKCFGKALFSGAKSCSGLAYKVGVVAAKLSIEAVFAGSEIASELHSAAFEKKNNIGDKSVIYENLEDQDFDLIAISKDVKQFALQTQNHKIFEEERDELKSQELERWILKAENLKSCIKDHSLQNINFIKHVSFDAGCKKQGECKKAKPRAVTDSFLHECKKIEESRKKNYDATLDYFKGQGAQVVLSFQEEQVYMEIKYYYTMIRPQLKEMGREIIFIRDYEDKLKEKVCAIYLQLGQGSLKKLRLYVDEKILQICSACSLMEDSLYDSALAKGAWHNPWEFDLLVSYRGRDFQELRLLGLMEAQMQQVLDEIAL